MTHETYKMPINGILAYGSVIYDPGSEIESELNARNGKVICAFTPFGVEFARRSGLKKPKSNKKFRSGAPTLVPYNKGKRVKGRVFVMNLPGNIGVDLLYDRETELGKYPYCKKGTIQEYLAEESGHNFEVPERCGVVIGCLKGYKNLNKEYKDLTRVLFSQLGCNIHGDCLTPKYLACYAILSVSEATAGHDGIKYLIDAKQAGVVTELSPCYEQEILRITESECLDQALCRVKHDPDHYARRAKVEMNSSSE